MSSETQLINLQDNDVLDNNMFKGFQASAKVLIKSVSIKASFSKFLLIDYN